MQKSRAIRMRRKEGTKEGGVQVGDVPGILERSMVLERSTGEQRMPVFQRGIRAEASGQRRQSGAEDSLNLPPK
ncbi:hypothetical protein KOW79_008786 [Hemibagrus wyckioides]|uniref:Uncharacterized protein n=1 Tax=Hemibagrus wyckioides TaxID=337641 RepID=A0A9D3NU61_9TELE|nr:hypothetical protein KOW79_008786 [Hemibagrus wyckioides]